jgi:ribonuclease VapC
MVIDSSAIVAIFAAEPEHSAILTAIGNAPEKFISAVSLLETCIVLYARTRDAQIAADIIQFFETMSIEVVPFDAFHASLASQCFIQFGKGFHPAGLNFGDCASYALAQALEQPLLFKGNDFVKTPIPAVKF